LLTWTFSLQPNAAFRIGTQTSCRLFRRAVEGVHHPGAFLHERIGRRSLPVTQA